MSESVSSTSDITSDPEILTESEGIGAAAEVTTPTYTFSPDLVVETDPASIAAESLSALVTQLISRHLKVNRRGIVLCSPSKGTGCTFMASNLAFAIANSGARTLLLDANLRSPGVQDFVQSDQAERGLLQLLTDETLATRDVVHTDVVPNLSVIYSGGTSANSGIFATRRFKSILDDYLRDFDFVIVDTPPSSTCSDTVRIASLVKYAAIIVRKDETFVNDVKVLVDELKANDAEVLGVYINAN